MRDIRKENQFGMSRFFQLMRQLNQLVTLFLRFIPLFFELLLLF